MVDKSYRVYLRELCEADINDEYLSWFANSQVTEFLNARNLTKNDVLEYIEIGKESQTYFMHAICDVETDRHIGNLKIGPIDRDNMTSDLVTLIGNVDFWGKGLATEAIELGNTLAFDKYDVRKLTGGICSNNIGSIKCYTRAGWIIEGTLKEHYIVEGKMYDRVCVSCFNPKYSALGN
jgi:RimJ/RimL family protein N-acetyltransferase